MIKTWTSTHPQEITEKANTELKDCVIHSVHTVMNGNEFILTVEYDDNKAINEAIERSLIDAEIDQSRRRSRPFTGRWA